MRIGVGPFEASSTNRRLVEIFVETGIFDSLVFVRDLLISGLRIYFPGFYVLYQGFREPDICRSHFSRFCIVIGHKLMQTFPCIVGNGTLLRFFFSGRRFLTVQ